MSETEIAATLFTQGAKIARALTEEERKQLISGEAKLALVPRGHRVIDYTTVLDRALKILQKLSPDELEQIEDGRAKLALLRKGEKIVRPFNPDEVAEAIVQLTTEGEILRHLDADPSLGVPNLKKVATALNLPLPPEVKSKQAIQSYIAENVIRDRHRWSIR